MIRKMEHDDLGQVMEIWLDKNKKAHDFIEEAYWTDSREAVASMLPQAEVYVSLGEDGEIQGFLGLSGTYIAGIFVREGSRSRGIGKTLLDYAKEIREKLTLHVYQKNARAVKFYRREGFRVEAENTDASTGEKEWVMMWE